MEKIVVSMTSYPKRIKNVAKSITYLLYDQILPPDEIHLWLAKTEFLNGINDLPDELVALLNNNKIILHWTETNTYCHKRHEIFSFVNNACVFFIDDDVKYNSKLIAGVMYAHLMYPNAIINYQYYHPHVYKGKKIYYYVAKDYSYPSTNIMWCGQSMIPANLYPKEVLSDENKKIRDCICPICDESWLTPWLVKHNIPILCLGFGWGTNIDPTTDKAKGLCNSTHDIEANGYEKRANWLAAVLNAYPEMLNIYKQKFNYGNE